MANYISNVLKVKGLSNLPIFSQFKPQIVDFETIIPSPKTIEECPKEYILGEGLKGKNGLQIHPEDKRPWFNWYDWHCDFWGCKWNACETNVEKENEYYYITFITAWKEPYYWIDKLAKLSKPFIFYWEEEHRYGQLVGYNGKIDIEKVWNKNEKQVDLSNENVLNKFFGE